MKWVEGKFNISVSNCSRLNILFPYPTFFFAQESHETEAKKNCESLFIKFPFTFSCLLVIDFSCIVDDEAAKPPTPHLAATILEDLKLFRQLSGEHLIQRRSKTVVWNPRTFLFHFWGFTEDNHDTSLHFHSNFNVVNHHSSAATSNAPHSFTFCRYADCATLFLRSLVQRNVITYITTERTAVNCELLESCIKRILLLAFFLSRHIKISRQFESRREKRARKLFHQHKDARHLVIIFCPQLSSFCSWRMRKKEMRSLVR